jgi:hypothetical protein
MLNPSTADAEHDDPTIRRCVSFANRLGHGSLRVINLFAWRATNPRELTEVQDPIGPDNDVWIEKEAAAAGIIIAAWGANAVGERPAKVMELLRRHGPVYCLGMTTKKAPRHPLYLSSLATLMPYDLLKGEQT